MAKSTKADNSVSTFNPTPVSIKECMVKWNISEKEAIKKLKNPASHETGNERSERLAKEAESE